MFSIHKLPEPLRLSRPTVLLSTGFGSGLVNPAPGTWGTLACFAVLALFWLSFPLSDRLALLFFSLILVFVSIKDITRQLKRPADDSPWIVSDEWVGLMIALTPATNWIEMTLGLVLFRVFDILKPGPVKWAENWGDAETGILADDMVAGCFAALCVWGVHVWIL